MKPRDPLRRSLHVEALKDRRMLDAVSWHSVEGMEIALFVGVVRGEYGDMVKTAKPLHAT
ncbi:MAG: hypothetical protein Q4G03_10740 [Planctomycetia bacterium]|nr:hypothetical protein [Planctomycetia bacterium]